MEQKKNLLILDPSPSMRALIGRIAEESGWQAVAVADLPEADQALKGWTFHAITTGTQLPSANYLQVLADFRARPSLEFMPVALITGDKAEDYVDEALAAGITEIFSKAHLDQFQIYLEGLGKPAETRAVPDGLRALVLDDDGSVGAYVSKALAALGLQTTLTQRVDEALGESLQHHFDLIVVDLVLKDSESGNQFIRLLRASEGLSAKAHLIAISGYNDPVRRQEAIRSGADIFLLKPFSAEELQHQVVRLLQPPTQENVTVPNPERSNRFNLSQRERMICAMVMAGHPDKYIAKQLSISFWTVRAHIGRIFRKCGVGNRVELGNLLRFASPAASAATSPPDEACANAQGAVIDWLSLASHVVDGLRQGVMVLDSQRNVIYTNPPFSEITGYAMHETVGKPVIDLCGERNAPARVDKIFDDILRDGRWSGSLWGTRKNGSAYLANVAICRMPPGMPMSAMYSVEISGAIDQHLTLQEISFHALYDALTGLPNLLLLKNRGELEIHRAHRNHQSLAVLHLNLDDLKAINHRDGHAYGDGALIEVACRLSAILRKSDTLARIGDEAFVALVADLADPAEAENVATKLLQTLAAPIFVDGKHYTLGASVGVSRFPDHAQTIEELIRLADSAMYEAKERGGNAVQCYSDTVGQDTQHTNKA